MKMKAVRPIYKDGKTLIEGEEFETSEQHGRELLTRGYATQIGESADPADIKKSKSADKKKAE
ncbi:hypothetical protein D3C87_2124040 [compost metagenome]